MNSRNLYGHYVMATVTKRWNLRFWTQSNFGSKFLLPNQTFRPVQTLCDSVCHCDHANIDVGAKHFNKQEWMPTLLHVHGISARFFFIVPLKSIWNRQKENGDQEEETTVSLMDKDRNRERKWGVVKEREWECVGEREGVRVRKRNRNRKRERNRETERERGKESEQERKKFE